MSLLLSIFYHVYYCIVNNDKIDIICALDLIISIIFLCNLNVFLGYISDFVNITSQTGIIKPVPSLQKSLKRRFISFELKTCATTVVGFYGITDSLICRLGIGENSGMKTTLYFGQNGIKSCHHVTPIYDCNSFQDFWIAWEDYTVEAGKGGSTGNNAFLTYISGTIIHSIDKIKVMSSDSAYWIFQI